MKRIAVIFGSAPSVQADLAALVMFAASDQADYFAVGLDAVDKWIGRIEYMATYHPFDIAEAAKRRTAYGGNTDYKVISHTVEGATGIIDMIVPYQRPSGSSALLAALAALQWLKYDRIILCGCPLEGKNAAGGSYEVFRKGWTELLGIVKDHVRSMSGWTRELLGAPTEEWLNAE